MRVIDVEHEPALVVFGFDETLGYYFEDGAVVEVALGNGYAEGEGCERISGCFDANGRVAAGHSDRFGIAQRCVDDQSFARNSI